MTHSRVAKTCAPSKDVAPLVHARDPVANNAAQQKKAVMNTLMLYPSNTKTMQLWTCTCESLLGIVQFILNTDSHGGANGEANLVSRILHDSCLGTVEERVVTG